MISIIILVPYKLIAFHNLCFIEYIVLNGQNFPTLQIGPLESQTNKNDIKLPVMLDDIKVQSAIQKQNTLQTSAV